MGTENSKIVVLGLYNSVLDCEEAILSFKDAGFSNSDISALFPNGDKTREFAHEKSTKAPEGVAAGGATGAFIGGAFGWLAGIGTLAIPGIGPFIAAGPIMSLLAGAGIGTALGALSGALIGMGIPEYEAKRYEGRVKEGKVLMSVHCSTPYAKAKALDIFDTSGASEVSSTTEASASKHGTSQSTMIG